MKRGDYYCNKCQNLIKDHWVRGDLPDTLESDCFNSNKKKKCTLERYYGSMPLFDVAEGKTGNSKTGYSNSVVYHPSEFSPPSAIKAKREGDWDSIQ